MALNMPRIRQPTIPLCLSWIGATFTFAGVIFQTFNSHIVKNRDIAVQSSLIYEQAELDLAKLEVEKLLEYQSKTPAEERGELFCNLIKNNTYPSKLAQDKLASLTDDFQTCYKLAEEKAKLEEKKKQCAVEFVYVTKGCRAYDKSGFHSTPRASCGISLVAGKGRFFAQERVEVVSESYRRISGRKAIDAILPRKPEGKDYITSFSGRIGCTNSSGTGRTCETKATVRAKSYPIDCIGKINLESTASP